MHNFYTKFNIWAAIGRKRGERAGLALALLTSQLECTCLERWLGYLGAKSSNRRSFRLGEERREEKGSEIQLSQEDAVFYGHSKTDALMAHKTISNTDMLKTYSSLVIKNM